MIQLIFFYCVIKPKYPNPRRKNMIYFKYNNDKSVSDKTQQSQRF